MPATGARSGTPAFSSDRVDAHTEPIDVEPLELSASETWRIAYGNSSRRGQHRHEGALGEEAVPDLATLRAADATGLTGRVRREVVVVQVALVRHRRQRVDLLLHLEHVQRGDTQDLGLAALEDRRAVDARDDLHLGVERTDVGEAATVDAHAVGEDAAAHDLLRDRLVGGRELERRDGGELARLDGGEQLALDAVLERVVGVVALDLVGDLVDRP